MTKFLHCSAKVQSKNLPIFLDKMIVSFYKHLSILDYDSKIAKIRFYRKLYRGGSS
jgi:hypothetical protein